MRHQHLRTSSNPDNKLVKPNWFAGRVRIGPRYSSGRRNAARSLAPSSRVAARSGPFLAGDVPFKTLTLGSCVPEASDPSESGNLRVGIARKVSVRGR
eukprot:2000834-Rhodomonas_salina.1